jgi:hypothetical protein
MTKSLDNKICCGVILGGMVITSLLCGLIGNVWAYIWTWIATFLALVWYSFSMVPGM